ncbi:unnamed protein product [Urochloa decumbens]|uniref:Uncharacterized protein n=1 Tax=Urochloa decumbens TaxID=240449 RepID=A0ABC8WW24_9POAL
MCVAYIRAPIHIVPFATHTHAHTLFFFPLYLQSLHLHTMEMTRSRSGGGKVVTFDDAVVGRRRNGGSLSSYLDIVGSNKAAAEAAARMPAPGMGSRRRTYADDGELDVFAAERYFKGAMDGVVGDRKEAAAGAAAAAETTAVVMARPSSTRASTASFTTASSAASSASANSQTALFRGGHRRRGSGGRRCCVQVGVLMRTCSGKRSVRVDDGRAAAAAASKKEAAHGAGGGEPAAGGVVDWYRELSMQKAALGLVPGGDVGNGLPPSLNLGTAKVAAIVGREMTLTAAREENKAAAAAELIARSSSVRRSVTLVAPVRAAASSNVLPPASSGGGGGEEEEEYDGGGSESSSDLFEIKSLMIAECCPYEPSEASIQWSVVTASAAADAASEHRGDRVGAGGRGPVGAGRQYRDHRPVGLLAGCASHRAVDVSAATKAVPAVQRRGDGFQKARNGGA